MAYLVEFEKALQEFPEIAYKANPVSALTLRHADFTVTHQPAPHDYAGKWINDHMVLYAFHDSAANRWLKIGILSAKNKSRFYHHHYSPTNSTSSLAKSIMKDPLENMTGLSNETVGGWIKKNCSRINVHLDKKHDMPVLRLLEAFMHVRFEPYYER